MCVFHLNLLCRLSNPWMLIHVITLSTCLQLKKAYKLYYRNHKTSRSPNRQYKYILIQTYKKYRTHILRFRNTVFSYKIDRGSVVKNDQPDLIIYQGWSNFTTCKFFTTKTQKSKIGRGSGRILILESC